MKFISSAPQEIKEGPKNMSIQDEKLCDLCRERQATCHIIYGYLDETKDLCEACHEASATPEELASRARIRDAVRNAKCRFCGLPAVGGSDFAFPEVETLFIWCEQCRQDLAEFSRRPENALPEDLPDKDEAAMEKLLEEHAEREQRKEEFMKQKVSARQANGDSG